MRLSAVLSVVSIALLLEFAAAADPQIPQIAPLFKQCSPIWGNLLMGGNNTEYDTICIQGCAMSSLAMALNARGYSLSVEGDSIPINPLTFNKWLQENGGYECIDGDCNNLVLNAPDAISPGNIRFLAENEKPSAELMMRWIDIGNPVAIAHVRDDSHFVLIVGYDKQQPNTFYVNDPYYNNTSYMYDDMTDLLTYLIRDGEY